MPKDSRTFAKFTVDFPDNPKIQPLSDGAFRCLVEATIWSREHLTDGFLATRLALARWSLENLQELCANDDENPSLIEVETGWIIRDFTEHQDTKADVHARRRHAIAAGRKGGLAKAKQSAKRNGKHPAKQTSSKVLSKNVAEEEGTSYEVPNARAGATPTGARTRANCRPSSDPAADERYRRMEAVTELKAADEDGPF